MNTRLCTLIATTDLTAVMSAALAPGKEVDHFDHFDNSDTQATAGLRTPRNHMDTAPGTQITVVALGDDVHFLKEGAKDKKNPNIGCDPLISDLVASGVKLEICEPTLRALDLKKDAFVTDAGFNPSGVVRNGRLQYRERYGYIKP